MQDDGAEGRGHGKKRYYHTCFLFPEKEEETHRQECLCYLALTDRY